MRPSYILSGTAMRVAHSAADLESDLVTAVVVSREHPVVISKFIMGTVEHRCRAGPLRVQTPRRLRLMRWPRRAKSLSVPSQSTLRTLVLLSRSQSQNHDACAGVHSGDATIVHPPQDLTAKTLEGVNIIACKVAKALHITGPFNIQLIAKVCTSHIAAQCLTYDSTARTSISR